MLYRKGMYQVEIADNGAIKVKPGDWLSKYSYAMYGNFDHINEFGRMNSLGVPVRVQDPNRIVAGETLYHLPTYNKNAPSASTPPPAPGKPDSKLSEQDKAALIEKLKSGRGKIDSEALEIVETAAETVDRASEICEMFELLDEIAGPVGALLSIVGTPLQVIAMWDKFNTQKRMAAARAMAYAETAWAFGDPVPPLSPQLRQNILAGGGMGRQELIETQLLWDRVARATFARLDAKVAELKISKTSAQDYLKAGGDNDKGKVCGKILKEFDKYMGRERIVLMAWQSMHDVVYPQ